MNGSVHEAILTSGADFNHFGATAEISGIQKYSVLSFMWTTSLQLNHCRLRVSVAYLHFCSDFVFHKAQGSCDSNIYGSGHRIMKVWSLSTLKFFICHEWITKILFKQALKFLKLEFEVLNFDISQRQLHDLGVWSIEIPLLKPSRTCDLYQLFTHHRSYDLLDTSWMHQTMDAYLPIKAKGRKLHIKHGIAQLHVYV